MANCRTHVLYRGAPVTMSDVECHEPASSRGPVVHATTHQLVFIRAGVFVRHGATRNGPTIVAAPSCALLLNREEPYHTSHPSDDGDSCTMLAFSTEAALDVASSLDARAVDCPDRPLAVNHVLLSAEVALRFWRLRRTARRREGGALGRSESALMLEEDAHALLAAVLTDGLRARGAPLSCRHAETVRARRELTERTKAVLAANPGGRRTLATLGRDVGSSPYHLTRVFSEVTGLPVHRFLLRLRLTVALERLDAGQVDLSALALELGFSSHSHFSAAFGRHFGISPDSFRRLGDARRRAIRSTATAYAQANTYRG